MSTDPNPSDETVARLLSRRNAPSVLEKEQQFERIFAAVSARPRWQRWAPLAGAGLAVAAALALWVRTPDFASRGAALTSEPEFRALCAVPCKQGGTLAFELDAPGGPHYFAAFAQRADGAIVWYLPDADAPSQALSRDAKSLVLDRGVQIGSEQPPGSYEIYGVFSSRALTRSEIKRALGNDLRGREGITVVRRHIQVEP